MEEHGLTQSDLPEIGSQDVLSEILRGKRELNVRQIRALATRFHVSPSGGHPDGGTNHASLLPTQLSELQLSSVVFGWTIRAQPLHWPPKLYSICNGLA
jgi:transcriptional regulator with XRE-family HTH domain